MCVWLRHACRYCMTVLYWYSESTELFYVCCVCMHACLHHNFHLQHTHWQAVPRLRSPHCCSHMPVGSRPQQTKPPEWQPYLSQTLAMGTRIVNNMRVPAGGTLMLRTNKISVKSHLQTAAKYKHSHLCHSGVLTSWNITEGKWKKCLRSTLLLWRSWRAGKHKCSRMRVQIRCALARGMCT